MKKAVFFDLDGTLLPMDQDVFVRDYMTRLAGYLAPHGYDPQKLLGAIWNGTGAMVQNDGSRTNEAVFWESFCGAFGAEARKDEPLFEAFYQDAFQKVQASCGFNPMSLEVIRFLQDKGIRRILATNPLFPRIATHSRVRWAGLDPADFEWITTYENASYCKPNPDYYREILAKMELEPQACIMVGNDAVEDLAAAQLGMDVFLLTDCLINKKNADLSGYPQGSMADLMQYLKTQL